MRQNHPCRLAAVQMTSTSSVSDNLDAAGKLIAEAAQKGAHLVALPENFGFMSGDDQAKRQVCEQDGSGPIQDFLADMAARYRILLIGGTVPLKAQNPDKTRNCCLAFSPDGHRMARYDKIHLFGFEKDSERYDESATIEAGSEIVTIETSWGKVGLSVCYDLRFPEMFRAMGEVKLLVIPAAFTYTTGQAHWEILLRARAIENQCYVLAPAQSGRHPWGRRTYGDSLIIDPWGEILARQKEGSGVVVADLDLKRLEDVRTCLPALRHRQIRS